MNQYNREVLPAPSSISVNGRCSMGTFDSGIDNLNLLDLDHPLGFKAPRAFNAFRLKEWQAFEIDNADWFICLAVYNTKSIGTAIIMAFNKSSQRMFRYEHQAPAWKLHVPSGLKNSRCHYQGNSKNSHLSISIENALQDQKFKISITATGFKDRPDLTAEWTAHHTTSPIVIVQPFADNRPLYSHKALMPIEGLLNFDGTQSAFTPNTSCAIVDDHKGFYPYVMEYDWVTALGFDQSGLLTGFNLTDNQVLEPERYNENCLWHDGNMTPLPPITISRPNGVNRPWSIKDQHNRIDLRFTPLADVRNYMNTGIAAIRYHGLTGVFEGYIKDTNGNPVTFDGFTGMGEKKYVRL